MDNSIKIQKDLVNRCVFSESLIEIYVKFYNCLLN